MRARPPLSSSSPHSCYMFASLIPPFLASSTSSNAEDTGRPTHIAALLEHSNT